MEKDQNSEALQIHRVKVSAGGAFQGPSNSSTFSQCEKTRCNVGHVIQQRMHAC